MKAVFIGSWAESNSFRDRFTPVEKTALLPEDDLRIGLAIQQTVWALERTQMAWVRTAFAIISAGFALDKGLAALHQAQLLKDGAWVEGGFVGGIFLTSSVTVQLIVATLIYIQRHRELRSLHGTQISRIPAVLPLSIGVILLGPTVATLLVLWN